MKPKNIDLPNKYQRILKLNIIKKRFDSLKFQYFPNRDVYEVYRQDKKIYATYAYRNIQEIIIEISQKLNKLIWDV